MHDQDGHYQVMSVRVTDTLIGLILMQPRSQGLSVVKIRDGTEPRQEVYLSVWLPARISRLEDRVGEVDSDVQRGTIRATVLQILKKQVFLNKFLYRQ